jgi:sialic acid synthase SpsE
MAQDEMTYRDKMRKQVVVACDLKAGQTITADTLCLKRTSSASALRELDDAVGRTLRKAIAAGTALREEDFR